MRSQVTYDLSALNTMVKSLSDKYKIQVGIFGSKNARRASSKASGSTNAEIGFKHEYGSVSEHIPPRSFLRMPLSQKGAQVVKEAAPFAAQLIAEGKVVTFLRRIGIACENVVQAAFATRGWGAWKPNAPSTVRRKKSDSPLIDTGQLRRAIASKVVKV